MSADFDRAATLAREADKDPCEVCETRISGDKARKTVRDRAVGLCEMRSPWCHNTANEFSHRIASGQGGPVTPDNGVAACGFGNNAGFCHGYAHQHPELAKFYGWIVPSGQDPAMVPAYLYNPTLGQSWMFLKADGGVIKCAACSCPEPTDPGRFWVEAECPVHGATAHRATPDNPMPYRAAVHGYRLQGGAT